MFNFNTRFKLSLIVTCILFLTAALSPLRGDDDEDEQFENREKKGTVIKINSRYDFVAVSNPKFKAECSSCHMIYLPGLLPARSWTKIMSTLDKHFGENAELDAATQKEITEFLVKNSSDHVHTKRGDKILSGIGAKEEIMRISETQYFKKKHDEISPSVFKRKSIGSAANCIACHSGAERGDFSEDSVVIPKDEIIVPVKK
jgi:nitrate/TMAO reductase-like tetraheme cytochrome c subunit